MDLFKDNDLIDLFLIPLQLRNIVQKSTITFGLIKLKII